MKLVTDQVAGAGFRSCCHLYFTVAAVFVSLNPFHPPDHTHTKHYYKQTYTWEPFHFSWFVEFSHLIVGALGR